MIELELLGSELLAEPLAFADVQRLCECALASAGVRDGHLAVELVDAERIAELNRRYRGKAGPTDVLSFPIDGAEPQDATRGAGPQDAMRGAGPQDAMRGAEPQDATHGAEPQDAMRGAGPQDGDGPPRELGDIVICPEHTADLREAIVHGALHLVGMDHETDKGEMLALQAQLLDELTVWRAAAPGRAG